MTNNRTAVDGANAQLAAHALINKLCRFVPLDHEERGALEKLVRNAKRLQRGADLILEGEQPVAVFLLLEGALLLSVKSRIDRGEPVDAATFCSLISNEELTMTKDQWDKVSDRYFTPEQKAEFADRMKDVPPGFDQADYSAKWSDLGKRVEAAIPLGAGSPEARALFDEWQELLKPFTAVATPGMMQGATKFYEKMDEWQGEVPAAPFSAEVFKFIQEVGRTRSVKH